MLNAIFYRNAPLNQLKRVLFLQVFRCEFYVFLRFVRVRKACYPEQKKEKNQGS
jgi:hypothetical protein